MNAAFAYTVGTGRLFMPMAEFHRLAEELTGHPIYTHEFADEATWAELRNLIEARLLEEVVGLA